MKLFKKVGAVFLALAMIAVMIPQLESKVVKAASTPYTYNGKTKDSYFSGEGVPSGNWQSSKTADFNYDKCSLKTGSLKTEAGGIKFTVTENKYAVVEFNVNQKNAGDKCYFGVKDVSAGTYLGRELMQQYPDLKIVPTKLYDAKVNSEYFMLPAVCQPKTEYVVYYDTNESNKESYLYQIKVTEYDTQAEAQAKVDEYVKSITEKKKYTVSGKITSEVDLTGGTVSLTTTTSGAGNVTSEPITKNDDGTYSYTTAEEAVVGGGAVYNVSVTSPALTEAKKTVQSAELAKVSFTVNDANKADADFEVKYNDITNIWDFANASDWSTCSYEKVSELVTYKGLVIDVTAGGKFATSSQDGKGRIQTNTGTKVRIPVSGWGNVTCTFGGKVDSKTTLGDVQGSSTTEITASYDNNAEYVELSIGASNIYIQKIEIKPESPVTLLGTAVRQETEGWGNGIRFGAALDLTKVDKDACTSGTLIGLESIVGAGKEMTMDDAGKTCLDVVRTTFIKEENNQLEYAAALINIPDDQKDTKIVARSYVKVGDNVYYGKQQTATWSGVAAAVNAQ